MNNYYHKFNLEIYPFDYESLKGQLFTEFISKDNGTGIHYYMPTNLEKFISLHPKPFCKIRPEGAFIVEVTGQGLLDPHIDHTIKCCINYYFEPNESVTSFHVPKENTSPSLYPGQAEANLFKIDDVDEVASFKAERNEAYVLNVSKIHSVYSPNQGTRKFISYNWVNHSFEEIVSNLC
jgi:hypothetical protein